MTHTRGITRALAAATLLAAAAPLALTSAPVASAATASAAAEASASHQATVAGTTATASGQYVAITQQGRTRRLQVVDRRTGKPVRTLASEPASAKRSAFTQPDLAADGSVYALRAPKAGDEWGRDLVRYRAGRATVIAHYVSSVKASPDGKTLAVQVDSPDGDGDGNGLGALRLLRTDGRVVRTLDSYKIPVTRDGGPTVQTPFAAVRGWAGPAQVVVGQGCCDEGTVLIAPTTAPAVSRAWPKISSSSETTAIGVRGTSVLVLRPRTRTAKGTDYDITWLNAKRPHGQVVGRVRSARNPEALAPRINRTYGASTLVVTTSTFPFRGAGKVLEASD